MTQDIQKVSLCARPNPPEFAQAEKRLAQARSRNVGRHKLLKRDKFHKELIWAHLVPVFDNFGASGYGFSTGASCVDGDGCG